MSSLLMSDIMHEKMWVSEHSDTVAYLNHPDTLTSLNDLARLYKDDREDEQIFSTASVAPVARAFPVSDMVFESEAQENRKQFGELSTAKITVGEKDPVSPRKNIDGHDRKIDKNDDENHIPRKNQAKSSCSHEWNKGGDSHSGDVGPSDRGDLGEGFSFSGDEAGGAGRSPNTNGNNEEDSDDVGLSRVVESNSTQIDIANWRQLLRMFCCYPSVVLRDHHIADVEGNSRPNVQLNETAPRGSSILRDDADERNVGNNKFEDDLTLSKVFYSWLEKQPEEEKEDAELVELHLLGKCIVDIIDKDQLVMLVPIHLLDDMNWYTDDLGIRLYVRQQLTEDQLQKLNEVIKNKGTLFKGVEQLVFVDVVASGVGGDNVELSDGSNNEGQEADGHDQRVGESNGEKGGSSIGVGPPDLDRAGSANPSGNNEEGVDGDGLSRPEASNSTQSMIGNWQHLLGSFCDLCCCCCRVWRDSRSAEVDEILPDLHAPSNADDNPIVQTPTLPPILSNSPPDSPNERTAAVAGLHTSEEGETHSNTSDTKPNIVNHNRETNVSQGINAAGSKIQYSNFTIFNGINPSAPTPEKSEDAKFSVAVYTSTTAVLDDKKQEFTIKFTLTITVTKSSHQFELNDIILAGGLEHLTANERYYFNNLLVEIAPRNAQTECSQVQPVNKSQGHWLISERTSSNAIRWCHKIDDPEKHAGVLRYEIETHRVEHKWEHFCSEPTEYSIDVKVGLTFSRHRFYTGARLQNDYDLVNSVSIRIKNIREHHKVMETARALSCKWELTKANYVPRRLNSTDTSKAFIRLAHFTECTKCCALAA
ncbi:hypothetical protein BC938DRAFT_483654, partial [Jimgerdemannia flammicorona]